MPFIKSLIVTLLTFISSLGVIQIPTTTTPIVQSQPQPTKPASNADISRNWSGYAASDGTYTGVSGTWTIPQVEFGNNAYGVDAAWVGIGGVNSHDLIQAGTQSTVDRNGQVEYSAFFETLPYPAQPLRMPVNAGDSVTVSLKEQSDGVWDISFKNNTTGQRTSFTRAYNSSLSSAEWIEEAPSSIRRVMPLADFGTITFTNATAIENNQAVNLAQADAQPMHMGVYGQVLAMASVLGNDGASFSVTRTDAQEPQQQQTPRYYGRGSSGSDGYGSYGAGFSHRHRHYQIQF